MKLYITACTHGFRNKTPDAPECDVLIHCGDFGGERYNGVSKFIKWLADQPAKHKIFIAGNHDSAMERKRDPFYEPHANLMQANNIHYLFDSSITIDGVKFFGSPWTKPFKNWSFMSPDCAVGLGSKWKKIPADTGVLITHGPPLNILDLSRHGDYCGSITLRQKVEQMRGQLKLHCFGHIHEGYGEVDKFGVKFINASAWEHWKYPLDRDIVLRKGFTVDV